MPRSISTTLRNALEAPQSSAVLLCFATITHADLSEPVRVVNDAYDYIYNSFRYYGLMFEFTLPDDAERPPRAKIRIPNVDQRIGAIAIGLRSRPWIKLEELSASDWGDPVRTLDSTINDYRLTRSPLGTPTVEYSADYLQLANVTGDAMIIEADVVGVDLTQEPWPAVRATRERLPGLFL